jgi:SAM-dependent methyltransferase
MLFRRASDMISAVEQFLDDYDALIRARLPADFPYPVRSRDWELYQVLSRLPVGDRCIKILDTGSFSTYTAFYLDTLSDFVTVSDSFSWLVRPDYLALPEITPVETWLRVIAQGAPRVGIAKIDLEHIPFGNETFDYITCISTLEHCRYAEVALNEMFRCLKPGGRLLLTTDHREPPFPYNGYDRFWSLVELQELLAPYPDVSPDQSPDYAEENWCYPPHEGVLLAFVEIERPKRPLWKRMAREVLRRPAARR